LSQVEAKPSYWQGPTENLAVFFFDGLKFRQSHRPWPRRSFQDIPIISIEEHAPGKECQVVRSGWVVD
jgi:hypothetical protein